MAAFSMLLVLAACGTGVQTSGVSSPTAAEPSEATDSAEATQSAEATASGDPSRPVGVIAIGHSGLTGEGTAGIPESAKANSWATGTNPEVDSVYVRLKAVLPETGGHVSNTAQGGASASMLPQQAETSLHSVPFPALAIISTIDNDIRCDGTDAEHVAEFGADVAEALELISTASPNTRILVVGQFGRPSISFVEELVAHAPTVKAALTGTGMCDFYDPDGNIVEANFETLTGIIEAYEAEQARVCAEVPNCQTDGGVRAAYVDTLENFLSDWAHLNVAGQAAQAELMWPVVEELLAL